MDTLSRFMIERDGYELGCWNLTETGSCQFCGMPLAGRFDPQPGRWGRRGRRLRLNGHH